MQVFGPSFNLGQMQNGYEGMMVFQAGTPDAAAGADAFIQQDSTYFVQQDGTSHFLKN